MPFASSKKKGDEHDGMWAEVAKFNQLLDYKIRLDNAEQSKKKVELQKEYLDVQIKAK